MGLPRCVMEHVRVIRYIYSDQRGNYPLLALSLKTAILEAILHYDAPQRIKLGGGGGHYPHLTDLDADGITFDQYREEYGINSKH